MLSGRSPRWHLAAAFPLLLTMIAAHTIIAIDLPGTFQEPARIATRLIFGGVLTVLAIRRLNDLGRSPLWSALIAVPLAIPSLVGSAALDGLGFAILTFLSASCVLVSVGALLLLRGTSPSETDNTA